MTDRKITLGTGAPLRPSRRRAATFAVVCDETGCAFEVRGIPTVEQAEQVARDHEAAHRTAAEEEDGGRS